MLIDDAFKSGKTVFVPKVVGPRAEDMQMLQAFDWSDIQSFPLSKWRIPEPPPLTSTGQPRPVFTHTGGLHLDVCVVPGVAFDRSCNRLGHGKGYYDCFLSQVQGGVAGGGGRGGGPWLVGTAMREQVVDLLPYGPMDVRLHAVATPDELLRAQ